MSKSQWTASAESVKGLWGLFEAIFECLDEIYSNNKCFDKRTRSKALGLKKQSLSFDLIVSIYFLKNIMYKLKCLTETLKTKNVSIVDAKSIIYGTILMIKLWII